MAKDNLKMPPTGLSDANYELMSKEDFWDHVQKYLPFTQFAYTCAFGIMAGDPDWDPNDAEPMTNEMATIIIKNGDALDEQILGVAYAFAHSLPKALQSHLNCNTILQTVSTAWTKCFGNA